LRKHRGLTQEELAFQAGINRNYVGQIEREEKSPTIDMIEKLSAPLSVEPIELLAAQSRKRK
jgi:transcriptional regulator with XRE-family HTH domain